MRQFPEKHKAPVYRRQRLLLYFLEAEKQGLSRLDLQKLLFLYSKESSQPHYNFVPYKYGCYSFLCADDLELLEKRGWIQNIGNKLFLAFENLNSEPWAKFNKERGKVKKWLYQNCKRGDALVTETYRRYPYYAFNSKMKERLLSTIEIQTVEESVAPIKDEREIVYTLGYEGIHLEVYLNRLIRNHVKVLCDVRRNPNSRKFGFSGRMLAQILPKFEIDYLHIPSLGIESGKRQELNVQQDYDSLFADYRKSLPSNIKGLLQLNNVIQSKRRVVLTCYEADPLYCHRHCVGAFLESQYGYRVEHL